MRLLFLDRTAIGQKYFAGNNTLIHPHVGFVCREGGHYLCKKGRLQKSFCFLALVWSAGSVLFQVWLLSSRLCGQSEIPQQEVGVWLALFAFLTYLNTKEKKTPLWVCFLFCIWWGMNLIISHLVLSLYVAKAGFNPYLSIHITP